MKQVFTFLIVIFITITIKAQEYSFIPKDLKELPLEELMKKGPPENLDLVFYEDGTKTTLKEIMPLIMNGIVLPKMFVDNNNNYKALVIVGGRYSFLPKGLKPISSEELMRRGLPKKIALIFLDDGTEITKKIAKELINNGKAMPQMFVDKNGAFKALVLIKYKDTSDPYKDIKNPTGELAKNFSIETIDGKKYTLNDLKGKKVVLNFWFISCKPCVDEMPSLNKLIEKYKNNKDVIFLAIGLDKKSSIKEFLKITKFNYQIVASGDEISNLYGVEVYPTHFVIGKDSKIEYFAIGSGDRIIRKIEKAINNK
ncbi:Peroxiredoxin [Tenacibaculum sp. MAR_2010_89]|uniref:peroxiredoxin family protein n=1 Tax=Tenacibaculum sp. MAR_2010_89 TaxID=1250198 RepID=UPI000899C4D7|nr:TlpA disulfide reductase family protein [Tenacibaculum sp. MAR_2010_89]SEE30249.1 Peroxiredoxin [Tenacibaculum sp. MAR_2010_89]